MKRTAPKILTIIFPSNYPNFGADSIFNFNRSLFKALVRDRRAEVFAAGLPDMPPLGEGIPSFAFAHGINKFEVRFSFPWDDMRQILRDVRPNICLVNMPEQTAAVSILARDELGLDCRIISYVHYIPAVLNTDTARAEVEYESSMDRHGHGRLVLLRLLEGLVASDLVLICSYFGVRLLKDLVTQHLHGGLTLPPVRRLPPPVDFEEMNSSPRPAPSDEPRLVYNHRLYDEYGTQKMFNLIERIAKTMDCGFKVLVTNPTEGRTGARARLNPKLDQNLARLRDLPFVEQVHFFDRSEYFGALSSSWAGIGPLKPNALWSMSVMDVLACGRPVLSFDIAAFREMGLPDQLLARSEDDFEQAFHALLIRRPEEAQREKYRRIAAQFSCQKTSHHFLRLVGGA